MVGLLVGEVPGEARDDGGEDEGVGGASCHSVSEEVEVFAFGHMIIQRTTNITNDNTKNI